MKLVCIADAHVHPWRLQSRDGGHDRLMDGLAVVSQSLVLASQLDAVWVFAGDMKQPKTSWPQSALTGLLAIFRDFPDVPKVMVAGNHDAEGEGGSGLAPFKNVPMTTVVEYPQVVTPLEDVELFCCPWNGNPVKIAKMESQVGPRVLIAHGFLAGCLLGPEDVRIAKGLSIDAYGPFDFAVFGDVHKAQWRVPENIAAGRPATWVEFPREKTVIPRGSVLYCGSPYQQNWGERNDERKGALVIDMEAQTAELYPLKAPRYRHWELDYESATKFLDEKQDDGDFVRIVYNGSLCSVTDKLRAWGETSCRSFQLIPRAPEKTASKRVEIHAAMSRKELLVSYMRSRASAFDQHILLDAGLRLAGVDE